MFWVSPTEDMVQTMKQEGPVRGFEPCILAKYMVVMHHPKKWVMDSPTKVVKGACKTYPKRNFRLYYVRVKDNGQEMDRKPSACRPSDLAMVDQISGMSWGAPGVELGWFVNLPVLIFRLPGFA